MKKRLNVTSAVPGFGRAGSAVNMQFVSGLGMVIAGAVVFSAKAIFVKLIYAEVSISAITVLGLRMGFALPFYLLILWQHRMKGRLKGGRNQLFFIGLLSVVGYYGASFLDFAGLQFIDASLERLILFVYPTVVVIVNRFVFRQRVSRIQFGAILITYLGIALAFFDRLGHGYDPSIWAGAVLVLFSGITYACFMVGSEQLIPKVGASQFTAIAMVFSCTGVLIHAVIQEPLSEFVQLPPLVYVYGLLMAVFSTVIPSFLVSAGIKRIGSSNAAIASSVSPVSTIVLATIFLGESVSWLQVTGTLVVIVAVTLLSLSGKKS